jgi:glycosyltransferase involved in cell wall biosynthesis
MHGSFVEEDYNKKYLALFNNLPNVYFVSLSSVQRHPLPHLNYIDTIPHGIDVKRHWKFDATGGNTMIWAGRAIKEKGINELLRIVKKAKRTLDMYPLMKEESPKWMKDFIENRRRPIKYMHIHDAVNSHELAHKYQKSKVLLFPIHWEEPFGLVLIEALASGTPVVAYARGSVPEVIEDGKTGFIVNPTPDDIKGDFIVKKTGIDGFCEAIEQLYALPEDQYRTMRFACRQKVENCFTVGKMGKRYIETYKKVIADWKKKNKG